MPTMLISDAKRQYTHTLLVKPNRIDREILLLRIKENKKINAYSIAVTIISAVKNENRCSLITNDLQEKERGTV